MIKNKKILSICTTAFFNDRGCHVRILKVLRYLIENGNDVQVVAYSFGRNPDNFKIERIKKFLKEFDPIGFDPFKFIFDIQILLLSIRLLKKENYDYILAFTHEAGIIAFFLRLILKKPYILDYQGSLSGELSSSSFIFKIPLISPIIKIIERLVERKSSYIIYNTYFNYKNSSVVKKYFFDDLFDFFDAKIETSNDSSGMVRVVWVGVNTKIQNLSGFLDIVERIVKTRRDMIFEIITFPVYKRNVERFLNFSDRIFFHQKVPFEKLPYFLAKADICVSTKLDSSEGSGKLHMFKKYCKKIISLDSKISRELLEKKDIAKDMKEIEKRIMEFSKC